MEIPSLFSTSICCPISHMYLMQLLHPTPPSRPRLLDLAGVSETSATNKGGHSWPAAVGYRGKRIGVQVARLIRSK